MSNKIFFRSDIELKKISIEYNKEQKDVKVENFASDIGSNVFLYMHNKNTDKGGLIIENSYIIKMKLHNNSFLPVLELTFKDPLGVVGNKLHPDDDSIISFYKKPNTDVLMPVRLDFIISNFRIINERKDKNDKIYSLIGHLSFNNLTENIAYKGTSFSVLQKISKKGLLGFASNINNTNDEMVWINPGDYISEFIPDIVKYSYLNDSSFLISFVDLYYNLNFIDVEKQLKEDTLDQRNIFSMKELLKDNLKEKATRLLLTNHPNMRGSNLFIQSYIIDNNAREVNRNIGYESKVYFYDKTTNSTEIKTIDTIIEQKQNKINLRSLDPEENSRKYNMGKQDQDNVHDNFLLSKKQNYNNIEFLQVIKMNIILQSFNMNLYRMQHVEVIIYELETLINSMKTDTNKTDSYRINDKLTGSWLITGISYIYDGNNMSQEITLVKKNINVEYDKEKLDEITKSFYQYKNKN